MQKEQKERLKKLRFLKRYVNVRQWSDYDRLSGFKTNVVSSLKRFFVYQKPETTETFEQAIARYHLSEDDLKQRKNFFLSLAIFITCMALGVLSYAIYLLIKGHYPGAAVGFSVTLFTFSLAFRYHFWYYQVKVGKLGCTFKEWFHHGLLGRQ